ncbi:MAG: cupin domain-containing protein [candidate division Zixibacteria bacterium]|nr:cupin domain-containing protein [candidate division Zixibacteria bacterium]
MSRNVKRGFQIMATVATIVCLNSVGVSAAPTPGFGVYDIDTLLMDHPLAADQPTRTDEIKHDSLSSIHLTQIRGVIQSHRHLAHEENVWVIRGSGRLVVDGVKYKVAAGQVIHIPKGASHSFYNMGAKPAVVISVFAPGFDGKDRIYDNPPPR